MEESATASSTFGHISVAEGIFQGMGRLRVVVVDDDPLVRRALSVFLSDAEDLEVVGTAEDGVEALERLDALAPDIALIDIHMSPLDGIATAAEIIRRRPATRVIAITTMASSASVLPMLRAGAVGYLLKDSEPEEIIEAVRAVGAGAAALSPHVASVVIGAIQSSQPTTPIPLQEHERLSDRELEILQHLATGMSNIEIAQAMFVSEGTVKANLSNVIAKWGVRDRVQVLLYAARLGLVTLR